MLKSLELIGSCIENCPLNNAITLNSNTILDFNYNNRKNVFFLKSGTISLIRKADSIIVLDFNAPALIGITALFGTDSTFNIRCDSRSILYTLDANSAIELFTQNNLWIDVVKIYGTYVEKLLTRDKIISSLNSYAIVKSSLEIIWEMDEEMRNKTSIYSYILNRNKISRSALHKILKELNYGGYIASNRGRLIDLKKLPNSF